MGMLKILFGWIANTPWYIRIYLALILLPQLLLNATIAYFIFLPWHHNSIQAQIVPMKVARDIQISNMLKVQDVQNKAIISQLNRQDQHLTIMYQAMLNARQPAQQ